MASVAASAAASAATAAVQAASPAVKDKDKDKSNHGHSFSEWRDTYQVSACRRHAEAWQRLPRRTQHSCCIEDLLLL
jgi:thiaminase